MDILAVPCTMSLGLLDYFLIKLNQIPLPTVDPTAPTMLCQHYKYMSLTMIESITGDFTSRTRALTQYGVHHTSIYFLKLFYIVILALTLFLKCRKLQK